MKIRGYNLKYLILKCKGTEKGLLRNKCVARFIKGKMFKLAIQEKGNVI